MSHDSRSHLQALAIILLLSGSILATSPAPAQCTDCDNDGFTYPTDCNDASAQIFPGQTETCNGFDDDCDGEIDEDAGCLRNCPFPDALAPPLSSLDASIGHVVGMAWSGSILGVANEVSIGTLTRRLQLSRFTIDGLLLGHTELGFKRVAGSRGKPSLVWTGEAFAVAWVAHDEEPPGNQGFLARVDTGGQLLEPPVLWRTCGTGIAEDRCQSPQLAWSGERFGVAWLDSIDGILQFMALERDGQPLPGTLVNVSTDIIEGFFDPQFGIAENAGTFGVVWRGSSNFFRRLSPEGIPLGTATTLPGGCDPRPIAAGNGWGVAQAVTATGVPGVNCFSPTRVQLTVLDATGAVTGGPVKAGLPPMAPGGTVDDADDLSVLWTGSEYALIWEGLDRGAWPVMNGTAMISRFDAGGAFISTRRVSLARDIGIINPHAVWTGGKYVVTWLKHLDNQLGAYRCDCSVDGDGDGSSTCSDCDDGDAAVSSYGMEVCDGINNNCYHGTYPVPGPSTIDFDDDGDGFSECGGDCDDVDWRASSIYPGAPQICDDQRNNDCNHPAWPSLAGTNEGDDDGDLFTECEGECDDANAAVRPFGPVVCDGLNNDCNHPAWPLLTGTEEVAGGVCELSGGEAPVIDLTVAEDGMLHWQSSTLFPSWNVYRGDLAGLVCEDVPIYGIWSACHPIGGWMQVPGENALAQQTCNTLQTSLNDNAALEPGQVAIFLVTGVTGAGPEGALGTWREIPAVSGAEGRRLEGASCP